MFLLGVVTAGTGSLSFTLLLTVLVPNNNTHIAHDTVLQTVIFVRGRRNGSPVYATDKKGQAQSYPYSIFVVENGGTLPPSLAHPEK